ncbi:type IV pilus biogenesis/stability protein PilW [Pseudoalteromonas xiamenensis]
MQNVMRKVLVLPFTMFALSGCVTQTTYVGSEQPVVENKIDNIEAAKTRISLALQYLTTGNTTQAKFNLERALNLAPSLPEVHYSLAYYYQNVGENAMAKNAYIKALEIEPNDPNTLNNYGAFLCGIGEYGAANEQFLKAIAIPSYLRVAQSYENLALCSIKDNKFDAAEQHLRSAINHNGQRQSSLLLLASLLYAKSDLHQAQQVLKLFEDKGFISAESLFIHYLVDTRMGRIEQAQTQSKTLLQTYPTSQQAGWVRDNTIAQSDVEQLREQYRQAQLDALTQDGNERFVKQPTIKITRKIASSQAENKGQFRVDSAPKQKISKPESTASSVSIRTAQKPRTEERTETEAHPVQFYEPDPNDIVFSEEGSQPQVSFVESTSVSSTSENTLLNPDIQLPKVPFHELQIGENLFSVSVKYNIKLAMLLQWNDLKESARLSIGSKVYLNNPRVTAPIEAGDSLLDVANRYQVMVDELMRWNKLTPDVTLKEGYSLLVVDPSTYKL